MFVIDKLNLYRRHMQYNFSLYGLWFALRSLINLLYSHRIKGQTLCIRTNKVNAVNAARKFSK